ncbi:MAG: Mov34/MPN/PAD-1 family protein [Acidilobaceae archaeon]
MVLGALKEVLLRLSAARTERALFLIGKGGEVLYAYWAENVRSSPFEFEAKGWHVVQAHISAERHGMEVIALAHTHPICPAVPSAADLRGMRYWPLVWIISCPGEVRGWVLRGGKAEEVEVEG